jgi:hypothetical protein
VFALAFGFDPAASLVDHINGVRHDNRPSNLQLASSAENVSKRHRKNANNTTGVHGVSAHKASGKFMAQIKVRRRNLYLGLFCTPEAAAEARAAAEREHFKAFAPKL